MKQTINKNYSFSLFTAAATLAACFILLSPRVRAFVQSPSFRPLKSILHPQKQSALECSSTHQPDGMPILPSDVVKYSQVPKAGTQFTAQTIPSGLLKQHTTKKGTWGVIRVSTGKLEYTIHEPRSSVHVLDSETVGVIEPTMLHQVKGLTDDVQFVVEFWRVPGTGVVDEKREGLDE
mmetsp:Transcript_17604/g.36989  ORF Transcript_17604/g.36989 Transcript_17604/m.36989 type:complete len:178 (+) Transcript_17604:20-553(+)